MSTSTKEKNSCGRRTISNSFLSEVGLTRLRITVILWNAYFESQLEILDIAVNISAISFNSVDDHLLTESINKQTTLISRSDP